MKIKQELQLLEEQQVNYVILLLKVKLFDHGLVRSDLGFKSDHSFLPPKTPPLRPLKILPLPHSNSNSVTTSHTQTTAVSSSRKFFQKINWRR